MADVKFGMATSYYKTIDEQAPEIDFLAPHLAQRGAGFAVRFAAAAPDNSETCGDDHYVH